MKIVKLRVKAKKNRQFYTVYKGIRFEILYIKKGGNDDTSIYHGSILQYLVICCKAQSILFYKIVENSLSNILFFAKCSNFLFIDMHRLSSILYFGTDI